jgi:hypothetical protein
MQEMTTVNLTDSILPSKDCSEEMCIWFTFPAIERWIFDENLFTKAAPPNSQRDTPGLNI